MNKLPKNTLTCKKSITNRKQSTNDLPNYNKKKSNCNSYMHNYLNMQRKKNSLKRQSALGKLKHTKQKEKDGVVKKKRRRKSLKRLSSKRRLPTTNSNKFKRRIKKKNVKKQHVKKCVNNLIS